MPAEPQHRVGFGQIQHLDARDRGELRPRLRPDSLRVLQMARVVIGDAHVQRLARGLGTQFFQKLGRYLCTWPRIAPRARRTEDRRATGSRTRGRSIRSRRRW